MLTHLSALNLFLMEMVGRAATLVLSASYCIQKYVDHPGTRENATMTTVVTHI